MVEKAHRNPRFVEDVVREMIRRVADAYPQLGDDGFVLARQENLETIHRHSVVAERSGLLDEIVAELERGEHSRHHMTRARVARGALRRRAASRLSSPARRGGRAGARARRVACAARRSSRRREITVTATAT